MESLIFFRTFAIGIVLLSGYKTHLQSDRNSAGDGCSLQPVKIPN